MNKTTNKVQQEVKNCYNLLGAVSLFFFSVLQTFCCSCIKLSKIASSRFLSHVSFVRSRCKEVSLPPFT